MKQEIRPKPGNRGANPTGGGAEGHRGGGGKGGQRGRWEASKAYLPLLVGPYWDSHNRLWPENNKLKGSRRNPISSFLSIRFTYHTPVFDPSTPSPGSSRIAVFVLAMSPPTNFQLRASAASAIPREGLDIEGSCINFSLPQSRQCCHCGYRAGHAPNCPFKQRAVCFSASITTLSQRVETLYSMASQ